MNKPERDEERIYTAGLIVVGDEILSGRTQDKNIAQVAKWLDVQGIRLAEVRVIPDEIDRIADCVNALRNAHDYLFTTGGIGPTHDDITVDAVAKALNLDVVVHPKAIEMLRSYYEDKGGLNENRMRMARVPAGAELVLSHISGPPGIRIENLILMAGVPYFAAGILGSLSGALEGGRPLLSEAIGGFIPEAEVAHILSATESTYEDCQIGSYPFYREGKVGANFVVRSTEAKRLAECIRDLTKTLNREGFTVISGGV